MKTNSILFFLLVCVVVSFFSKSSMKSYVLLLIPFLFFNYVIADVGHFAWIDNKPIKVPYTGYDFTISGYDWANLPISYTPVVLSTVTSATVTISGIGNILGFSLNVGGPTGTSSIVCTYPGCYVPDYYATSALTMTVVLTTAAGTLTEIIPNAIQYVDPIINTPSLFKINRFSGGNINLTGQYFGVEQGAFSVAVGNQLYASCSTPMKTYIVCSVPGHAPGVYSLIIDVWYPLDINYMQFHGSATFTNSFEWTTPAVSSISPTTMSKNWGSGGRSLTLTGANFGTSTTPYTNVQIKISGTVVLEGSLTSITDGTIVAYLQVIGAQTGSSGLVYLNWSGGNVLAGSITLTGFP